VTFRGTPLCRALSVLVVAAAGGAVLAGLPAQAEVSTGVTGVVQQVIAELPGGRDDHQTLVVNSTGAHEVTGLESVPTGTTVRTTLARSFSAAEPRAVRSFSVVAPARRTAAVTAAASYTAKPVVVVPIQWSGHPVDKTGQDVATVVTRDADAYWKDASDGRIGFTASKVLAPVTLSASFCSSTGGVSNTALKEIYAAAGMTPGQENGRHLLAYAAQDSGCAWAGMATISNHDPGYGGWVVINGLARLDVVGHELGHNLGLGHSSLRWCPAAGGTRTADAASGCQVQSYRDPYDIMGIAWGTSGNLSAVQRDALGLLSPGGITELSGGGQATLAPLGATSGVRGARLVDGTARYWLEYRTAAGRDSWVDGSSATSWYAVPGAGVVIHRADTLKAGWDTELIDTQPTGAKLDRAALRAGESWSSPSGKVTVTVVSTSASGAVVRVNGVLPGAFSLTGAPSAPTAAQDAVLRDGAVGLSWSASAPADHPLARYEVLSDGAVLATTAPDVRSASVRVPAGRHTVTVRAVDTQGQARTSSNRVRYLIDPVAPVVSAPRGVLARGRANAVVPVTVSWQASDAASGLCRQQRSGLTGSPVVHPAARAATDSARPGVTTWRLTATDCAGNSASRSGSATMAYVQENTLRYTGRWTVRKSSDVLGRTYRTTGSAKATATATVRARSVALVASKVANQGAVQIRVDGRLVATVDLRSSRLATRQVVWTYAWASTGRHTVTITNLGTRGRPSANVDALVTLV
jgi:hypothetical protein